MRSTGLTAVAALVLAAISVAAPTSLNIFSEAISVGLPGASPLSLQEKPTIGGGTTKSYAGM